VDVVGPGLGGWSHAARCGESAHFGFEVQVGQPGSFAHPDVADAAVVGGPDERWGETVAAFIRAAPGSAPTADELHGYCREHLAHYKCPNTGNSSTSSH